MPCLCIAACPGHFGLREAQSDIGDMVGKEHLPILKNEKHSRLRTPYAAHTRYVQLRSSRTSRLLWRTIGLPKG